MTEQRLALDDGSLVDLLDRLVNTGLAVDGDVILTLAEVELIRLDLQVILSSIGSPREARHGTATRRIGAAKRDSRPSTQAGLAGLVLAVVDIVRQLLERQALRRMRAGTLTEEEVERLGRSLMALESQTRKLATLIKEL